MIITIGQGAKSPQGRRAEVDDLATYLGALPPGEETWWSGHVWRGDYRRADGWESSSVIVLDVDHHGTATDAKRRHTAPSEERRRGVEAAGLEALATLWHHTPRGIRVAWALAEPCTDAAVLEAAQRGGAATVTEALRAVGVHARRDAKGRPIDGYAPDVATYDLARLMFTPTASVGGVARLWPVVRGSR